MSDTNLNDASFTPEIQDSEESTNKQTYSATGSFRFWCQKVLPLVYDDSLSYYELLCKVVNYLNSVIQNVDNLNTSVDNTNTAFNNLQNYVNTTKDTLVEVYGKLEQYVNDYFNNLDVQKEINSKLDSMAKDGSLSTIISPFIPAAVSDWLSNNIKPTSPAIDASLSVSGAGADAKVTGDRLSALNERIDIQNDTLDSLNSNYYYDISEYGETNPSFTINNLSFVYDSEEHVYNINGSSDSAVNRNIYKNSAGFPNDIKAGDIVRINYIGENSTANCYIQIFFYINNSWDNAVYVYSPKIIQIPSSATGMLIRIVVTSTASVTNGVLGFSMYRNASNNELENAVPYIKPDTNGDLTSTIEMMLNAYGHVKLGAGTYTVNNLHMPDNSTISGCGNNTILRTTDGTAHAIIPGAWCNIENLKIVGTKGTISSKRSVDAGIYIAGNYEDTPLKRNIKISNCTISDFGLAGIYGKATGYWVADSISAVNCEMHNCYAGILLEDYCEFNRFTNILTYGCYVGLMNKSGNNVFVNCSFSNNTVGVYLDCTDDATSNNNGHGAVIGATINHSNNNNGYGILVKKVETNGFIFDACQIWYSKIQIENSSGVIVQNCTFGGGTPLIESYTNDAFFLKNNLFKTEPTLTGQMIKEGNYLFDGSVVA